MKRKLLFNLEGSDDVKNRQIIGGSTSNLMNLNNVKYKWAIPLYQQMRDNFWIPEKVDMSLDVIQYHEMTSDERVAYDGVLSFLIFLDSIQTNNIPNVAAWVTSPELVLCLTTHAFQEAVHAQSYQYIIETTIPTAKREGIYDLWRTDPILLDRNQYIAGIFQDHLDDPSIENFHRVLIANYILEGLYFYNGFSFFYNLCSRHLMSGTTDIIRYINRDEMTHMRLFQKIILELEIDPIMVNELMQEAVNQEIKWTNHIIGDRILGINELSTEQNTKYLANLRLKAIGVEPLYPGFTKNPYSHLDGIADTGSDATVRGNFFETTITSYKQSSTVDGWNDF